MTTAIEQVGNYLESFTEFEKLAEGRNLPWLRKLREDAFARFCETGFPTTHEEDWRFTNVSEIARTPFRLARQDDIRLSRPDLDAWQMEGAAAQLVFLNGRFTRELSSFHTLPEGVVIAGLREQMQKHPEKIETYLGRYIDTNRDPFCALNTAFTDDGAYIHIARGIVVEAPIHLLFLSTAEDAPTMTHPRNLIVAEDESQATVVEDYASFGRDTPMLSNTATELIAGENAVVSHSMVEREHSRAFNISTLRVQMGRSANVASHSFLLGGSLVRNNVHPMLAGAGGECLINGLFIGRGHQHLDNYMHVEHASPHCSSRQFYNGVLDGHAHGIFHGRIVVHKDAQKTDAKQTNRNLLLSDDAQIDTKPQLEIHADDVKCTHGATIGQIEEGALFYLRSRGLDEASARKLLLQAFAGECLDRLQPGTARIYIESLVQQHLLSLVNCASSSEMRREQSQG